MKNLVITCFLMCLFSITNAQNIKEADTIKHHEIKTNIFNLIIFKSVDFSYEYIIDTESSIGISMLFNLDDREDNNYLDSPYYRENFAVTPYYRRFFSSKPACGFFLEAFGMYNIQADTNEYTILNELTGEVTRKNSDKTSNNIAFGMAVGGKFVAKKGFLFEFFGGIGRNIITSKKEIASEFVPRLGATIGWRF